MTQTLYRIEGFYSPITHDGAADDTRIVPLSKVAATIFDMSTARIRTLLVFRVQKDRRGRMSDVGIMADGSVYNQHVVWHRIDDISLENALHGEG